MNLTALDWSIVAGYFVVSTLIGLLFTKRGGRGVPIETTSWHAQQPIERGDRRETRRTRRGDPTRGRPRRG